VEIEALKVRLKEQKVAAVNAFKVRLEEHKVAAITAIEADKNIAAELAAFICFF
jgi:hypothetical protein